MSETSHVRNFAKKELYWPTPECRRPLKSLAEHSDHTERHPNVSVLNTKDLRKSAPSQGGSHSPSCNGVRIEPLVVSCVLSGQAKVSNLQHPIACDQEVGWLQVLKAKKPRQRQNLRMGFSSNLPTAMLRIWSRARILPQS
jgi:hypothetical protein